MSVVSLNNLGMLLSDYYKSFLKTLLNSLFFLLIISFSVGCQTQPEDIISVESPNGKLVLNCIEKADSIYYSLTKENIAILKNSKLGFKLKNQPALLGGMEIISFSKSSYDSTWQQPWGEKQEIRNNYNELKIELAEREGLHRKLNIVFRVYNDGIGFRYVLPEQENLDEFEIADEITEFNLKGDFTTWSIKANQPERFEYLYRKGKLSEMADTVHSPLTMSSEYGYYISIHEAALTDYASMTLYSTGSSLLKCDLVPWSNGTKVYGKTPFKTPWRTIQVVDKPGDLVTSYLILNLNESNKLEDVSWAKPAKYIGIWWEMHLDKTTWSYGPRHGANTQNVKKYIDFAADNGFGGVLVEGWNTGWEGPWYEDGKSFNFTTPYPDFNIEEISEYGASKGVSLIGHHETGGNVLNYESQLDAALDLYQKNGVRYIKTGYVNREGINNKESHHGQFGVRHYRKVVEEAAKRGINICAHEPIKATGIRRTYPNMMTREGARGQEFNAWGPNGGNPPNHTTILPFTRLLGGPMDFTPGIFDLDLTTKPNNKVNTTLAKQLALYVVIYSPLQMAADLPENYKGQPAFQFIKDVPVDWEDTKVLNGEIGEYITTVRHDRYSDDWFLGSITNEKPREFNIKLSFLEKGAVYKAVIYKDAAKAHFNNNAGAIEIDTFEVTATSLLSVILAPGGGQAIRFKKVNLAGN